MMNKVEFYYGSHNWEKKISTHKTFLYLYYQGESMKAFGLETPAPFLLFFWLSKI